MKTGWTIGKKLIVSFIAVAAITLVLGIVAIVSMLNVTSVARHLAEDNVPAVAVANNVERMALNTMFEARGYAYTDEQQFLDNARRNLARVHGYLEDATAHATRQNMPVLGRNAEIAGQAAREYEQLLNQTVQRTEEIHRIVAATDNAAAQFVQVVEEYLNIQESDMNTLVQQELGPQSAHVQTEEGRQHVGNEVLIRTARIKDANDILDQGNEVIINT